MTRVAALALSLVIAAPAAFGADDDTRTVAQAILTRGAALYDTRDAAAMAATYLADARVALIGREADSGNLKTTLHEGRAAIEELYKDLFKDKTAGATTSRNTVIAASYAGPDVLIIQGTFQPDVANEGTYPFVQVRVKVGDAWLIKDLQIFVITRD